MVSDKKETSYGYHITSKVHIKKSHRIKKEASPENHIGTKRHIQKSHRIKRKQVMEIKSEQKDTSRYHIE